MIKLNPIRIETDNIPKGTGTGTKNQLEVIPYTKTGQVKVGISTPVDLDMPKPLEQTPEILETLKDLRPYQIEDVLLFANRAVGLILNEPRTGKTPTALFIFKLRNVKKFIVISPTSVTLQWKEETERWIQTSSWVPKGTPEKRAKQYKEWEEGALIIGYDLLRKDVDIILKTNKDIEGIIIDEAHRIKNHKAQQTNAVLKFKKIKNRLALTGTLASNKQYEIYPILAFLFPSVFRGYWRFIEYYFRTTEEKNWSTGRKWTEITSLRHPTELQEFLERIAIRRRQKEVMKWLPDKEHVQIKLEPNKEQKKYIKELLDMYETEHIIVENTLVQLVRIRQICNAPELLDLKGKSPKLEWIKQFKKDYPDKPVVIFSFFTEFLKIVNKELENCGMIIGGVSKEKRNQLKKAFQEGEITTLLVQVQAGKEGLTLDTAEAAIFCDVYPPASDIEQSENRITATTEDKKEKENTIYQLMMKDTYDENFYSLIKKNKEEIDVINDFKSYLAERRK